MKGLIVNIDVPDLEAAMSFYQNGLEFELQRTLFDGAVAELSAGGVAVYLIEQGQGAKAVPNSSLVRNYSNHWTPVHLDIVGKDLEASLGSVDDRGFCTELCFKLSKWRFE